VVDVPCVLSPRIEDNLLITVARLNRRDDALDRIVAEDWADTGLDAKLEPVSLGCELAEEGFVLPDRVSLVVGDRPAATDPARIDNRAAFASGPWLCLNLLLDFTAEAIGV